MKSSVSFALAATWCAVIAVPVVATAQTPVQVSQPWVRATVPHQPATGAFMQLQSTAPLQLIAVDSPVAKTVELHEMRLGNDIMRMRQVAGIAVPPGQTVALQPGGYHVMLIGLHQPVTAGQQVPLTLTFETAQGERLTQVVQAEVRALGAAGGHAAGTSHAAPAPAAAGHGAGHAGHAASAAGSGHAMPRHPTASALPAAVVIESCWVRALPAPLPSAAYFTLRNGADHAIVLERVAAPGFGHVMLHTTEVRDGMAAMASVPHVEAGPGETVTFAPGGLHVMLEQPAAELTVGGQLPLTFETRGHAPREVACEIRSARG